MKTTFKRLLLLLSVALSGCVSYGGPYYPTDYYGYPYEYGYPYYGSPYYGYPGYYGSSAFYGIYGWDGYDRHWGRGGGWDRDWGGRGGRGSSGGGSPIRGR